MKKYAPWKTWAWRFIRGAVATAIAQSGMEVWKMVVDGNFSKESPQKALQGLTVSFISGFFLTLGLAIREKFGGDNKNHIIHKLPI